MSAPVKRLIRDYEALYAENQLLLERVRDLRELSNVLRNALITGQGSDEAIALARETIGTEGEASA